MAKNKKLKKDDGVVGYSGDVEAGFYRNGHKFKQVTTNAGTRKLFEYLCGCLAGTINANYSIDKRPGKLRLYDSTGKQLLTYGVIFNDFQMGVNVDRPTPNYAITINFLIPGVTIRGKGITGVKLLSMDDVDIYAEAEFNSPVSIEEVDTNLYVAWTLTIYNG